VPDVAARKLVSVLYPVLNEEENAVALAARMLVLTEENGDYEFEFVVVDDGSTDDTIAVLRRALAPGLVLRTLSLARNFGSHAAISAGLEMVAGDAVIILGADLQEPPKLVTDFLRAWESGYETAWGIRRERRVPSWKSRLASALFSKLLYRFSELKTYPPEGPSGCLCDRQVINAVLAMPERNRNIYGLVAWVGFRQTRCEFDQDERQAGHSKWTTSKLIKLAIDSFVQFSATPIRFMSYAGMTFAGAGFIYALVLAIRGVFSSRAPEGWTTVVVIVLLLGGIQLVMLGVLGEYLWRGVHEARERPLFVARRSEPTPQVLGVKTDMESMPSSVRNGGDASSVRS
jgi:polyisoprenyl-phosphate glycosyltransferase